MKAYKNMDFGTLWGGLSYRRSIDGAQYTSGNGIATQKKLQYTPIVGVNFNNFMFAYTYSHVAGAVKFDDGGYHQITLGINLFCKPVKYECNCPPLIKFRKQMLIKSVNGKTPLIPEDCYVAENATMLVM
jgi:hypothetical protein